MSACSPSPYTQHVFVCAAKWIRPGAPVLCADFLQAEGDETGTGSLRNAVGHIWVEEETETHLSSPPLSTRDLIMKLNT